MQTKQWPKYSQTQQKKNTKNLNFVSNKSELIQDSELISTFSQIKLWVSEIISAQIEKSR